MLMVFNKIMGTSSLSSDVQKLVQKFVFVNSVNFFVLTFPLTFLFLFVIDKVGFAQSGILFAIMVGTQFVFDLPSGALGLNV